MPSPDREAQANNLAHYVCTGERRIIGIGREVLGQHKDGTRIPLRLSVSELSLGARRLFMGILHDIRPYKQAEAALRQAHDELEERVQERTAALQEANADILRFTYIVSHDLQAPLINLKGFSGEMRQACAAISQALSPTPPSMDAAQQAAVMQALQQDIPEALGFIDASVTRMGQLIQAVLQLSRLGRQELHYEAIATADLVRETLQTLAHQIVQHQVQVSVGTLPIVQADRTALAQIFGNLLNNSIIYLEPHRPGVISISAEQHAAATVFHIQDNGRGIAAADIPRVFEAFQRVGRQDVPGDGMGLAYVRRLVRRHGGEITCQSMPGVGTTFTFSIARKLRSSPLSG
jgi:signal transduction histidine kinase